MTEFDVLEQEPVGSREDLVSAMEVASEIYVSDVFMNHVVDGLADAAPAELLDLAKQWIQKTGRR